MVVLARVFAVCACWAGWLTGAAVFVDQPELCADTITFLTNEKRMWLGGRYISVTWDMPELLSREKEIVDEEKLKITMKV